LLHFLRTRREAHDQVGTAADGWARGGTGRQGGARPGTNGTARGRGAVIRVRLPCARSVWANGAVAHRYLSRCLRFGWLAGRGHDRCGCNSLATNLQPTGRENATQTPGTCHATCSRSALDPSRKRQRSRCFADASGSDREPQRPLTGWIVGQAGPNWSVAWRHRVQGECKPDQGQRQKSLGYPPHRQKSSDFWR
jgi:hypothetical protein